ncbi:MULTISPECIES: phage tail fiber protein [Candidatus Nitrosocaldus]|jgi:hypothetical protein|uniref:Uncharacterized protein n=1 Tax=Candidatus Nitrosocaldus cavascurensis TaxID=2058097 RepID=A0A2K5ANU8_9ARCH|nr:MULTISPECIES: hypothetical protein [Candidatus Nitrosocaldus]SPC33315.1 conserved protein of unknown function [Candidatus Nitrosocaldus cavascurensis]
MVRAWLLIGTSTLLLGIFLVVYTVNGIGISSGTSKGSVESAVFHDVVLITVERNGHIIYRYETHNLITDAGKDFIKQQAFGTASSGTAQYIALSTDSTPPSASDTTLVGEITSQGLERAQGTATSGGTGQITISKTFTMTSGANPSFTINKAGLFDSSSGGTLVAVALINNPPTLQEGDSITINWQINIT